MKKVQREFLCPKILKISIVIKNVIGAEDTLVHTAERPSNFLSNTHTYPD